MADVETGLKEVLLSQGQFSNVDDVVQNFREYVRTQVESGFVSGCARFGLSYDKVSYIKQKPLLKDVSGALRLGQMTAVIGGADSGASTLIEVLAGRQVGGVVNGKILVDGRQGPHAAISYVPLTDNHLPYLTVRETIEFSIRMRCSHPHFTPAQQKLRADVALRVFNLENCADTLVGDSELRGISIDEMRRLSVAIETVCGHAITLANEPTNGLDPSAALTMIQRLKQLVLTGHFAFMATLKQPTADLLALFDEVVLLSDGMCIYHGSPAKVLSHFRKVGYECPPSKGLPEFLEEITIEPTQFASYPGAPSTDLALARAYLTKQYCKSDHYKAVQQVIRMADPSPEGLADEGEDERKMDGQYFDPYAVGDDFYEPKGQASFFRQVLENFRHDIKANIRYPVEIAARVCRIVLFSLLIGFLFSGLTEGQNAKRYIPGLLFFMGPLFCFGQVFLIPSFMKKRPVFYRQRDGGYYTTSAYFLALLLSTLPSAIADSAIFTLVDYYWLDLREGHAGYFFAMNATLSASGAALCLFMAALVARSDIALATTVPFVGMSLFVGGFMLPADDIEWPLKLLYYLSMVANSWRGMMLNQFEDWEMECDAPYGTPCPVMCPDTPDPLCVPMTVCIPKAYYPAQCMQVPDDFRTSNHTACSYPNGNVVLDEYDCYGDKQSAFLFQLLYALVLYGFAFITLHRVRHESTKPIGMQQFDYHRREHSVRLSESRSSLMKHLDISYRKPFATYLTFRNLGCRHIAGSTVQRLMRTGPRKVVFENVSGYLKPGEMVALLAPSGSGKTTLLDLLVNDHRGLVDVKGDIRVNDQPYEQYCHRFIGYVRDDDSHLGTQTVREAITFSAMMRNDDLQNFEKLAWIEMVIDQVGLRHVENEPIGTRVHGSKAISKVIRKKVSIAVELAMNPSILLLDEPTTGFDFSAAATILKIVRSLANNGAAAMVAMNQPNPEIIQTFDRVILMNGGRILYQGPTKEMLQHCAISDLLNFRTGMLKPEEAAARYESSAAYANVMREIEGGLPAGISLRIPIAEHFASSFFTELYYLTTRFVTSFHRTKKLMSTRTGAQIGIAVLLSYIFWDAEETTTDIQNRLGIFLGVMIATTFTSCGLIPVVEEERASFYRETNARMYRITTYFFARLIAELPLLVLQAFFVTIISYPCVGLQAGPEHYMPFLLGMWLLANCVNLLTFLVATLSHNSEVGIIVYLSFVLLYLLTAGYMVPIQEMPEGFKFIRAINFLSHIFAVFMSLEFDGLELECTRPLATIAIQPNQPACYDDDEKDNPCCWKYPCPDVPGEKFIDTQYGLDADEVWDEFGYTFIVFLVMLAMAHITLRHVRYSKM